MKLWVDDVRPAPEGYKWAKSVSDARKYIEIYYYTDEGIEVIDLDHDAGDYAYKGGDFIHLLNWMEFRQINNIPIHLHTMNPVGRENMRRIIEANGWKEIR